MIREFGSVHPQIGEGALVAESADVVGDVRLGAGSSVWYQAVIRADGDTVTVGAGSNVQDGACLHVDAGRPLVLGANVSVGHRAVLHGCTVGDTCVIGMGAILLNGSEVGEGCIVAAGALLPENRSYPPRSLIMGAPARVVRAVDADEYAHLREVAEDYRSLARMHFSRSAPSPLPPTK